MQPAAQTSVAQVCLKPRWCYSSESEGSLSSHSEALPNSTELEINLHQQLVKNIIIVNPHRQMIKNKEFDRKL